MDIFNFLKINDTVLTAGQPTEENLKELADDGVGYILNLSPTSTKNYLPNEAEIVESLKMKYIHFPIDCSVLYEEQYKVFKSIFSSIEDKKVFIHCGGNVKSLGFYHIYRIKELGDSLVDAKKDIAKIGVHDQKWEEYFTKLGAWG